MSNFCKKKARRVWQINFRMILSEHSEEQREFLLFHRHCIREDKGIWMHGGAENKTYTNLSHLRRNSLKF